MQSAYKRNVEPRSRNHYYRGKAIIITYSECVFVALVIQHVKCTRRIMLSSVAYLAVSYFSTLFHRRSDLLNVKCVWIFSITFVSDMSPSNRNSARCYHKCT